MTRKHERSLTEITRDTRSLGSRISSWVYIPKNFKVTLYAVAAATLCVPLLWPIWLCIGVFLWLGLVDGTFRVPLRVPKDVGGLDPSDLQEFDVVESAWFGLKKRAAKRTIRLPAGGAFYFGKERSPDPALDGLEVWGTVEDVTTHMTLAGTTGSGKTRVLMALSYNALLLGSGLVFADGKAQSTLAYELWCMTRRIGREDSFLVLSFLTGNEDPIARLAERVGGRERVHTLPQSNTFQPFADGESSFLLQLLASLLAKASGDGAQWQQKAINLADAVLRILTYKRAMGEGDTSVVSIREAFALEHLVKYYIEGSEGKIPELAFLPIKAYFETGLPGFVPGDAAFPEKWDKEVRNQHGYLTGQFARMLSMLTDSYGHIFNERIGEIDPTDVLINNRVLAVLIPTMGRSQEEAAALGKLYLSAIRLTMARNLGYQLEGKKHDIVDVRSTNTRFPTPIINDEIAYYFAEGLAVVFAQARSLNFFMVAAFQDKQGLMRGEAKDEVDSVIANTKFKYCLALEDPDATFELFRKAAGQSAVDVIAGYESSTGMLSTSWSSQTATRVEVRDRLNVLELKGLDSGQGVMLFKDKLVRLRAMYIPSSQLASDVVKLRINRFLNVPLPAYEDLPASVQAHEDAGRAKRSAQREIAGALVRGQAPAWPHVHDPIADAIADALHHLSALGRDQFTPEERAIVIYQAASERLASLRAAGHEPFWHSAASRSSFDDEDVYPELSA